MTRHVAITRRPTATGNGDKTDTLQLMTLSETDTAEPTTRHDGCSTMRRHDTGNGIKTRHGKD